ncbi:dihydrofolate reductase [Lepagella muris]|jgi:dihydrofolate reductase|uniref:Dihydrofolate reductase n=1 Tax=Lepagella muris TaxID=3032870 RepID=A0AC61REH1_9BACT|nr:dihydrofolate reductase [Lepagella muris]ROT03489.1 dihydrofolate reductase [Muribaculaceae bacterium Isolate-037 (Harlan)]TGY77345.1 dihydrofolate reductase [Lepagella muris]THG49559.1 dihydrofolate reductase [Bacteroidales bacterium]TKC54718.1 dihydrofolate reductase [Bacteroidales bacterium]
MDLNIIVAAGRNGEIGREGDLIWRISSDLKRFRSLTMGHPIIMGRKTWDSLSKKPLPGRRNIVMSRNAGLDAPGAEVVDSPEAALHLTEGETPFVMGGEQIYRIFLPYATRIYLTEIDASCDDADAWLLFPPDSGQWRPEEVGEIEHTPDGIAYRYVTYEKIQTKC